MSKPIYGAKSIRSQIMDWMQKKGIATRREIVMKVREIQGFPFRYSEDDGYYSAALLGVIDAYRQNTWCGYFRKPTKRDPRYLEKVWHGVYAFRKEAAAK